VTSAPQTTVTQLKQLREQGQSPCLLDVREDWEVKIAAISGSLNIPLQQIPRRLKELDAHQAIIVVCKVGARSQRAADFLLQQGFNGVSNLQGGIDAWADEIEPGMNRY
jgi:adenylyltransferase/sulfurtransferase